MPQASDFNDIDHIKERQQRKFHQFDAAVKKLVLEAGSTYEMYGKNNTVMKNNYALILAVESRKKDSAHKYLSQLKAGYAKKLEELMDGNVPVNEQIEIRSSTVGVKYVGEMSKEETVRQFGELMKFVANEMERLLKDADSVCWWNSSDDI